MRSLQTQTPPQVMKENVVYSQRLNRLVIKKGTGIAFFWSPQMLDYLQRHFPTTLNEELAGIFGVSSRTLLRKARELGLEKDPVWLHQIWDERRQLARIANKAKGYPGAFKKRSPQQSLRRIQKGTHRNRRRATAPFQRHETMASPPSDRIPSQHDESLGGQESQATAR